MSLLVRVTDYRGFDPAMLFKSSLWPVKLAGFKTLRRYAIVGVAPWMQGMANMANPLSPLKIAVFNADEEDEARDWAVLGLDEA